MEDEPQYPEELGARFDEDIRNLRMQREEENNANLLSTNWDKNKVESSKVVPSGHSFNVRKTMKTRGEIKSEGSQLTKSASVRDTLKEPNSPFVQIRPSMQVEIYNRDGEEEDWVQ